MMIGWLWRVLIGTFKTCEHDWKFERELRYFDQPNDTMPHSRAKAYECTKCKDMKRVKI